MNNKEKGHQNRLMWKQVDGKWQMDNSKEGLKERKKKKYNKVQYITI